MKILIVSVLVTLALIEGLGFTVRFADPNGQEKLLIREGESFCLVVHDPAKGACGISKFTADLVIFDFKTGAYIELENQTFQEFSIGSGIFFWVDENGRKRVVQVGGRKSYTDINEMEHSLGSSLWQEGNWEYIDETAYASSPYIPVSIPSGKKVKRIQFEKEKGRFENNDTLIAIVADKSDPRNIAAAQMKIWDTVSKVTVNPTQLSYSCKTLGCQNITVRIEDPDENLDPNTIEYVPFFVIVNPGGFIPDDTNLLALTDFCLLLFYGGLNAAGNDILGTIRWYNVYDAPRYIDYPNSWLEEGRKYGQVVFFAAETGPNTGIFEYNFGNLEQLQKALGFAKFPLGTTIAFFYVDPNDFDDVSMAWAEVGKLPRAQVLVTDAYGVPVNVVRIGDGIYIKVLDANANHNACCPDSVCVALCDPHGEDDCEWIKIDEISNNSGIFFSQSAMKLLPVWDAVGGYQLVWLSGTFEAYNEDTILIRYNSVRVHQCGEGG